MTVLCAGCHVRLTISNIVINLSITVNVENKFYFKERIFLTLKQYLGYKFNNVILCDIRHLRVRSYIYKWEEISYSSVSPFIDLI